MSSTKQGITKPKFRLGWKPDVPDLRDHYFAAASKVLLKLPPRVDLRSKCPTVFNQGDLGSCTANSSGSMWQFVAKKTRRPNFVPSRLFLYYNSRAIEGTINEDSGAQIRDVIKSLNKEGICPEKEWTYNDKTSKFTEKPPKECYTTALEHQALSYQRVIQNLQQMKGCLADGFPFVFGFSVYDSFFNISSNGIMPIPDLSKEKSAGGHAVMAIGYDDVKQVIIVRNSWGKEWGDKGYFYMPYSIIADNNCCDDFWTLRVVE